MHDIIITRNCKNCAYYRAHYAKDENEVYYEINEGHCENKQTKTMQFRKCMKYGIECNFWKQSYNIKQSDNLYDTVKKTANRVKQLAEHLNFKFDDE